MEDNFIAAFLCSGGDMESDYLEQRDFKSLCDSFVMDCDELKKYTNIETLFMHYYLDKRRIEGDNRDKNQIYIEWIKIYSEQFRMMYVILRN